MEKIQEADLAELPSLVVKFLEQVSKSKAKGSEKKKKEEKEKEKEEEKEPMSFLILINKFISNLYQISCHFLFIFPFHVALDAMSEGGRVRERERVRVGVQGVQRGVQ